MANSTQTRRYGVILKSKVATDFSLGTVLTDGWGAEGSGANGNLITRTSDTIQNNFPVSGVNTVTEHYIKTPFPDIKAQYFAGISATLFARATLSFTATEVIINLNQEE